MSYKEEAHKSQSEKMNRMKGGRVNSDAKEDKKLIKAEVKPSALKHRAAGGQVSMDGAPAKPRSDRPHRGGKSKGKSKGGASHVNVLVNPKIGGGPDMSDPSMAGDPGAAGAPMPPPPSGGAPMAPPPGPMGGGAPMQPPMRTGGAVRRATGGKVIDDGAGGGAGRLEKIKAYGGKK